LNTQLLSYNYPSILYHWLAHVSNIVKEESDSRALFLLGSTARGELSYLECEHGAVELFSDFEFLVVTTSRISGQDRHRIQSRLHDLEKAIANPNPLFHIDVLYREKKRLTTFPPLIFTYELKENAKQLDGENILSDIPDVTLANLDLRNTNEILYKRLWAILLYLPQRFFSGHMSQAERRVAGYVLCRNALDLTTVLLPYEGILLSTYQQRVQRLREEFSSMALAEKFGADFPSFLDLCLQKRKMLDFERTDIYNLYEIIIRQFENAFHYLSTRQESSDFSPTLAHSIFNEWPISRGEWYNIVRISSSLTRSRGPATTYRWLRTAKKVWLAWGLLSIHKAFIAYQQGLQTQAWSWLHQSLNALTQIQVKNDPSALPHDFVIQVFALRQEWAQFWQAYIRLGDAKYQDRFASITRWQHD